MVTAAWLLFRHWSQVSLGDESGVCVCGCVCAFVCVEMAFFFFAKAVCATHRVLVLSLEGLDRK